MRRLLPLLLLVLSHVGLANAHEIRPAYLEITEQTQDNFQISWKQPVIDGRRLVIDPILPEGCQTSGEPQSGLVDGALVNKWRAKCDMRSGEIRIAGLERTLTDVFVKLTYLEGGETTAVLKPDNPVLDLSQPQAAAAPAYVQLGFEHILSGPDHLLFVAALLALVPLRKLFWVITAFTLAHSLTLALTIFGLVSLAPGPVETLIAISIVLIAVEAINALDGRSSLASRWPWLISFSFGLLHGFGFAGALGEIGLPERAELAALAFFNIGVELGQIAFICVLLALTWALLRLIRDKLDALRRITAYGVGVSGVFWTFERMGTLFAVA